jgi:cytochrome oxidase Cu insertion factor (SCO1/SenC/PrrC family)
MTTLPPTRTPSRPLPRLLAIGAVIIVLLAFWRFLSPAPMASGLAVAQRKYFVPPFSLTERSGRTITNNNLLGKIWVADFVYTTCPGPCPLVSASMAKLQEATASDPRVQLVTFTVDPTTDTPAVLSDYADKLGANPSRWWFLTGGEKQIYDVVRNGFLLPIEDNSAKQLEPGQYKVTHSTQVALVDGNGVIQGYFDGISPEGRADVLKAIAALENQ